MKDIVIIAGSAVGSVLALARAIKKTVNCKAYVLGTNPQALKIIESSRFIDKCYLINGRNEEQFIHDVKKWRENSSFKNNPILYFTYDTACVYVDRHRDWFESKFILCMPSSDIIENFTEKGIAETVARTHGLTIPKTRVIQSALDIDCVLEEFNFPVIIKPTASRKGSRLGFKVKILNDQNKFKTVAAQIRNEGKIFVTQEYIPGTDEDAWYYIFYRSKNGVVWENMGKKILQSPPGGGIMAKGIVEYNSGLSRIAREFLQNINYNGIGGIEFKKSNDDYYFIEMSVRLEGFHQIGDESDSTISLASYYDLTNQEDKLFRLTEKKQKDGLIYIAFIPTMVTRIKTRNIKGLMKDITSAIFSKNVSLNIYSRDDSKPFWNTLKRLLIK